ELAEREQNLARREHELAAGTAEVTSRRTELVAEEARVAELMLHAEERVAGFQTVDKERAGAAAELAKQLATIGERERGLKRELEERLAARESTRAEREEAVEARDRRLADEAERLGRERAGHGQASQDAFALLAELDKREERLQQREQELAEREAALVDR